MQLYRKTKALYGYSPNELMRIARLKRAASLLASTEKTVAEITYEVGFSSPSYFTKCYKEYFARFLPNFSNGKKAKADPALASNLSLFFPVSSQTCQTAACAGYSTCQCSRARFTPSSSTEVVT